MFDMYLKKKKTETKNKMKKHILSPSLSPTLTCGADLEKKRKKNMTIQTSPTVAGADQIPRRRHNGRLRGGQLREQGNSPRSTTSSDVLFGPYGCWSKRRRPFSRRLRAAQVRQLPCEGEGEETIRVPLRSSLGA